MAASAQHHREDSQLTPSFQQIGLDVASATPRYARHITLAGFGAAAQERLAASRVLIVGVGGLGSPVVSYLAAAGVGRIAVVDDEAVDLSNLQRQVIHRQRDIGVNKAVSAGRFVADLNEDVEVVTVAERFDAGGAFEAVAGMDCVVDCTDNFSTRYLLNDVCVAQGVPLVWASIMEFSGQMSVAGYEGGPCYRCLFPTAPAPGSVPSCGEAGVLGVLPGIMGSLQANEVIKVLTGIGESLSGRVLLFDALAGRFDELSLAKNPLCPPCGEVSHECATDDSETAGGYGVRHPAADIEWSDIDDSAYLLDVREPAEIRANPVSGVHVWPLSSWNDTSALTIIEESNGRDIVVVCASGKRSREVADALARAGGHAASVRGGVLARPREHSSGINSGVRKSTDAVTNDNELGS